jgi:hypothetical protein
MQQRPVPSRVHNKARTMTAIVQETLGCNTTRAQRFWTASGRRRCSLPGTAQNSRRTELQKRLHLSQLDGRKYAVDVYSSMGGTSRGLVRG